MPLPFQTPASSVRLQSILDAALSEYKKKTGNDLLGIWLAQELQSCNTIEAVLDIIQHQAEAFDKFRGGDKRLMKWIGSSVQVLYTISATLGEGVGMVRIRETIWKPFLMTWGPRCFLLRKQSLPELVSSSLFVRRYSFVDPFNTGIL